MRSGDGHLKLSRPRRRVGAWLLLFLCANVLLPAQALANAFLRIVHAVPGAGAASLNVKSGAKTITLGPVAFGQSSDGASVPSGPFTWTLTAGGKTLFSGTGRLGNGAYTGVLMYKGSGMKAMGVMLHTYRNQRAASGHSAIRFIHAAPELGNPTLKFDGRTVATDLAFMMATPYLSVSPGAHVTVTDRGAPLTRSSAPSSSDPASVVVAPGDSLWKIAAAHVAPGAGNAAVYAEVIRIWNANAGRIGTGDPNLVFPGTRLSIPR
jgi:hypothetical protein